MTDIHKISLHNNVTGMTWHENVFWTISKLYRQSYVCFCTDI